MTHGPLKERNFKLKLNKKMRQGAMFSVFSRRVKEGEVKIVDSLAMDEPKTKELSGVLSNFTEAKTSFLIIPSPDNKHVYVASRNIQGVKSLDAKSLNVYDLLRYKNILLEKDAIGEIEKHYNAIK